MPPSPRLPSALRVHLGPPRGLQLPLRPGDRRLQVLQYPRRQRAPWGWGLGACGVPFGCHRGPFGCRWGPSGSHRALPGPLPADGSRSAASLPSPQWPRRGCEAGFRPLRPQKPFLGNFLPTLGHPRAPGLSTGPPLGGDATVWGAGRGLFLGSVLTSGCRSRGALQPHVSMAGGGAHKGLGGHTEGWGPPASP